MVSTSSTTRDSSTRTDPKITLTPEQLAAFGAELDAIRTRVIASLGDEDATYIRNVVKTQRAFEVAGRALFYLPPAWPLAVAALSVSKILDNMEIGHNVMHGQYDWMGDPTFTITVRGDVAGLVSKHLARTVEVGTVLHLSQAEGDFTLPSLLPRRILMVSGGSGITPVMSMLRTLVDFRYEGRITFVHYARTPEETVFADELDAFAELPNVDLHVFHTRTGDKRLNALQLRAVAPSYARTLTYACGPAGLVQTLRELYGDSDLLRVEYFKTTSLALDPDATGSVSFTRSGETAPNSGGPLLEQAEALGLRPAYGCRMGICLSCTSRKTAGTVRNVVTGAESSRPDEDIQICVSQPVGDCVVDL